MSGSAATPDPASLPFRKPYTKPRITHELKLETRAGSPLSMQSGADNQPAGIWPPPFVLPPRK